MRILEIKTLLKFHQNFLNLAPKAKLSQSFFQWRKIFEERKKISQLRKRRTEKEKEESIWKKKINFRGGKEKQSRKTRKVFGEGKYIFLWRRKNREGKGGNNWTRKIHFFAEREGKGGKYLEKENIFEIKYISYFFAKEDILHICHICHL